MKNLFPILAIIVILLAVGCSEKDYYEAPEETDREQLDKFVLTRSVEVPVKEGHITVGTLNGTEIFRGNYPATIEIPKFSANTRNTDVDWHYVAEGNYDTSWHFTSTRSGTLTFEDIPNGDNDYNDFVCFFKEQFQYNLSGDGNIGVEEGRGLELSNLEFYPKAMGNTLPLSFGIEIVNLKNSSYIDDYLIFEDVREECFNGHKGFINTDPEVEEYPLYNWNWSIHREGKGTTRYYPAATRYDQIAINYYIVVNGTRYYTADSGKALLTQNKTPYGLLIPNVENFKYPIETCPIWDAYPNFRKWIDGQEVDPFANANTEFLY